MIVNCKHVDVTSRHINNTTSPEIPDISTSLVMVQVLNTHLPTE